MSHHNRGGFTLVELLVVIVIIGMLVALLVPAVMSARESARQAKCTNNQKELGTAVVAYETSKGRYPGYLNRFGPDTQPPKPPPPALSWVVMVLSDLGRADLWREVRAGRLQAVQDVSIDQLVCPSDIESESDRARLSYVPNCGRLDRRTGKEELDPPPDLPSNGVFHHQYYTKKLPPIVRKTHPSNQVRLSASDIQDGTAQTLMLAEHVRPRAWTDVRPGTWTDGEDFTMPRNRAFARFELKLGFIWRAADTDEIDQWRINNFLPDPPIAPPPGNPPYPGPHPGNVSSNHPGGVIVTFCDGHTHFLNEDVHYRVYQHLMTPDSRKAWSLLTPAQQQLNLTGVLSEGDY